MKRIGWTLLGLSLSILSSPVLARAQANGACDGDDPTAVAAVRAEIDARCDCTGARNHGKYVSCAAHVVKDAVKDERISGGCGGAIKSCQARSTCGKPGAVTCCKTDASGNTRCSVKNDADHCKPPKGGTACVGTVPTCCDACTGGTCGGVTTTTTTITTTTTATAPPTTTTTEAGTTTTTTTQAGTTTTSTTVAGTTTTSTTVPATTTTTTTLAGTTTTSTTVAGTTTTSTTAAPTTTTTTTQAATTTTSTTQAPTTTTTTTTTSTTTTTTTTSTTTTTIAGCNCCSSTRLQFTTKTPEIGVPPGCGTVSPGACINPGVGGSLNSCSVNGDCPTGEFCMGQIDCGGLYFGGSGVSVPVPSVVPDQSSSITTVTNCNGTTGAFTIGNTTDTDIGGAHPNRSCTSGGVTNPEYPGLPGCLFGPPLPVPNANASATSTCVINRIVTNATGNGTCEGESNINFNLNSDLYLDGDLLPTVAGIQPCPICTGGVCQGGGNNGLACTPGDSNLGDAYPTSHDCPPPAGNNIGFLPIPFALTTGSASKTTQPTSTQTAVFCGFCRSTIAPNAFENPPHACTSATSCTTGAFRRCEQRNEGAFGNGLAETITVTGEPAAACLAGGAPQAAKLVSVFCIPPSYNGLVDGAADLPGPGAVALTGSAQLLP